MLADYCETQEALERCRVDLRRLRLDCATSDRLFDRTIKLGSRLSTLARQLRLTVQWTTDRRATKAGETSSANVADALIGGRALSNGLN